MTNTVLPLGPHQANCICTSMTHQVVLINVLPQRPVVFVPEAHILTLGYTQHQTTDQVPLLFYDIKRRIRFLYCFTMWVTVRFFEVNICLKILFHQRFQA